jgi:hypothetical protein
LQGMVLGFIIRDRARPVAGFRIVHPGKFFETIL